MRTYKGVRGQAIRARHHGVLTRDAEGLRQMGHLALIAVVVLAASLSLAATAFGHGEESKAEVAVKANVLPALSVVVDGDTVIVRTNSTWRIDTFQRGSATPTSVHGEAVAYQEVEVPPETVAFTVVSER